MTRTLATTIVRMRRLVNTTVGGPRYEVTTVSGAKFRTKGNAGQSYAWVPDHLLDRPVVLTINSRNQIIDIVPED